jgi:hypothetical protein
MAESENSLKLDAVPEQIREALVLFTEKLNAALGENLKSITVVGSSLTTDFKPGRSDVNTVLVLGGLTAGALDSIAELAKPMSRKKISVPLLMTPSYIERSLDVFGVEFLDFQLTHKTILGSDPFASLGPVKKDVRLQCERELKAMLIRLRQGYIAAAANRKLVRDILISTIKGLVPLLRAMLWLKSPVPSEAEGTDRPAETEPTFKKAGAEFSIGVEPLTTVAKWQYERIRPDAVQVRSIFESVYSIVDKLAVIVDELEV